MCECVLAAGIIRVSQYCVLYSCTHFFRIHLEFTLPSFSCSFLQKSQAPKRNAKKQENLLEANHALEARDNANGSFHPQQETGL